jgi:hypothetical protein
MSLVITLIIFGLCFSAMAIGLLISGKALKKGCSDNPDDCACRKDGKDPDRCSTP